MLKPRKSKSANKTSVNDPAVRRCIIAALRVIARSQLSSSSMSGEVANFLGALALPVELVASFSKAGQRLVIEKALRANEQDDKDVFDEDECGPELWTLETPKITVGHVIAPPPKSISRACQNADSRIMVDLVTKLLSRWEKDRPARARSLQPPDWLETNAQILKGLFSFTEAEVATTTLALALANVNGQNDVVSECINDVFNCRSERKQSIARMSYATGFSEQELASLFDAGGSLRSSGLLENVVPRGYDLDDALRLSGLGQLFASEQFDSPQAVRDRVLTPIFTPTNNSLVFTHLENQRQDIAALLNGAITAGEPGVNVLLYGGPGTGKTEFARMLVRDLSVNCFEVGYTSDTNGLDATRDDRLSYLKLANRLIKPEERAVILLDEAEDIFDYIASEPLRGRVRRRGSKAWMNALLETIRIPTIWITNDIAFDAAHLRRFAYVTEFDIPPVGVRRQIVRSHATGLDVKEETIFALARNDALTPAMLGAATRFVRLAKFPAEDVDTALLRHTQSTQQAMGVEPRGTVVASETPFDPRFINLDSTISIENLTIALKRTGRAALLFSGPSGTGKTQLANYLASQLDRELIYRTGSDLLNKYVGETEQRISRLFKSCDAEREIIFLDEAEGLLASREGAHRSWEVTQVNEFLRQIEQFKGIFIAATNHVANLDAALMRRFSFRFGFKPLLLEQRMAMLSELTQLSVEQKTDASRRLAQLDQLTAGDFANVKRRSFIMSGVNSIDVWLDELAHENYDKNGAKAKRIGFAFD